MPHPHLWTRPIVPAIALLLCTLVAAPTRADDGPPVAEATDYSLTVHPDRTGPAIGKSMYGVFYEDINHAADGGLYAELVQNRSFEYDRADNAAYSPMTAWSEAAVAGATGRATTVDDDQRLGERNRRHLRLDLDGTGGRGAGFGVTNSGWNQGLALRRGERYDFSVWARTDRPAGTALTVAATTADGTALATPLRVDARGDRWAKYTGTLTARGSAADGRLTVTAAGGGTVRLDMISLFPRDTYKGRPNGLRKDLAEKTAALHPGFLRFPGGCLVNTGSHEAYEAPNWERKRSYQWKDTIGPVEQRPVNANFWGYNQTYGLGYYEYFQFAEDIGAMALPVVPALVTGCGQNRATDDPALLRRHIQDTLDLIEFANGPAGSTWGAKRAAMGHPAPFGLTHLEVGNEENLPDEFFARFTEFREAIEARYPGITVISNSGPDDSGTTFDRAWQLNRDADVAMVDEHYYNSPQWFLENNARYDTYDRRGPKVFLGEYASLDNRFSNALAEAAYMTGLERNADVVELASYAPLFADTNDAQWRPDMIWFDNEKSWGSANYEVQKLFMNNVGNRVVPSTASSTPATTAPITGAVGLSTWATAAAYDDVRVTGEDGTELLSDDFSAGDERWTKAAGRGDWAVQDGAYVQSDESAENTLVMAGDTGWQNYDLKVRATKKSGKEGFLVAFGVKDTGNTYWWNLGGWGNTRSAVEKSVDGAKQTMAEDTTTIETGRAYDVHVQVRGRQVTLFLDGEQWGTFTDDKAAEPFRQVVTRDDATGDLVVKVVNAQAADARTRIDLGAKPSARTARLTTLQAAPEAVNTAEDRQVAPRTSTLRVDGPVLTHTFPAHSVTFLRIRQ
ncbi:MULTISPECIES: alpha-L-arabinofuranosidase C-terminal domain-containing protein [unclassified Streptomyces]|uniref:alpha-L-arabinofuranosidase C-terminal domain-containing protein n=1 Tax=unclassified Streptomyces TaxID=2593676 RepID=UPI0011CA1FE0|nr:MULTISPECIES: alpha-L-arabinofuranosidase C-terminal domain-containing protein [unclassified Streptomyces]TXS20146.1 alpha-N-arabinofuranosidase [Streptomyces sp. wa22]WSQ80900.1 alpha-N-arabinofuranosidase [Streptomyces sp. NBC_01213]WSQ88230.1 alpha-N-arabinofuranosidase [Streptomyces sp. NBC_01212]WSR05762.1 alpha-N-arabinofuranosidase [Streptomyces sp. NBC_01208]